MNPGERKRSRGLTLVEVMVATRIIVMAVIGAMGYRYYGPLDARSADVRMTATRVASMLLDGWVAAGAYKAYNPVQDFADMDDDVDAVMQIAAGGGPPVPSGFTAQGSYSAVVPANNCTYYATLSYKEAGYELRLLNAEVAWKGRGQTGPVSAADPSVRLTTYAKFSGDPATE